MSATAENVISRTESTSGGISRGLLWGMPVVATTVLLAWMVWRNTAHLDAVETRSLAFPALRGLLGEHFRLMGYSSMIVVAIAIPLGILLTRPAFRWFAEPVLVFANIGQAAPFIGLIVLLAIWMGFGVRTGVVALSLYALLPVLRNTIVGLNGVDPTLVEAGRGMGMSGFTVLREVELPLALPVILAGLRTSLVLVVGTATFGAFIDAGGLGSLITTGITLFRTSLLVSGAVLVGVLTLLVDWLVRLIEAYVAGKS